MHGHVSLEPLVAAAVFAVFCPPANGEMRASDKRNDFDPKLLDIRVRANGFGRASAADLTEVVEL
jgi:hypothetical protein